MRHTAFRTVLVGSILAGAMGAPALAQDGAEVFERACASCHVDPAPDSRAQNLEGLRQFAPEAILTALMTGRMFRQGSELTDDERVAVAGFAAGRPVGAAVASSDVGLCRGAPAPLSASDLGAGWNGWGGGVTNTRYQPADRGGLTAPAVPQLRLKWAFGFPGVNSVRAQPTVVGGRLFVGSEAGDVFALDAKTGCTHWSYHAQSGIRAAVSIGPYTSATGATGYAAYFADQRAIAYAVDAETGREIWSYRVDDHTYASSTGSPTLYDGRLYVVTSGVGEEGQGGRPGYACCTFRGSVTALDANTGRVVWKSYSIPESQRRGTSSEGLPLWGPAGGGIWAAPTIDRERRRIYVATGNGYAEPAQLTTDAVLALDMDSGKILWSFQPIANDIWTGGCGRGGGSNPNCPEVVGPDYDFSMPPVLATRSNGDDILVILQKSGMAYGLDPNDGALVWEYKTSEGGGMGGQWGAAVDRTQAYFSVNGTRSPTPGGVRAVNLDSGEEAWSKEASERLCGDARGCSAAQGAAVTVVPGIVFSGSMDGGIRAYASENGEVVWQFDTNREFDTVNGVRANGGAMDGPGAAVVDGMLYINSGYISLIGRPGNVLLAFGVE